MTLVQLDSALDALSNGVLGKARACSQQKLQSVQYSFTFYRHVRGLHIIISHIRNTNSNFPMKCMDFRSP